jgi:DNA-binding MarR family transcriptional regulator
MKHHLANPSGIEDFLLYRMSKVIALGGSLVTRICEGRFGITRREWSVLAIAAREQEMPWSQLRERTELDDARLSRAVSSLVEKGLARKSTKPNRQVVVNLTDTGREIYAEIFPIARDINSEMLRTLEPELTETMDLVLTRLHERAQQLAAQTDVPKAGRLRGRHRP